MFCTGMDMLCRGQIWALLPLLLVWWPVCKPQSLKSPCSRTTRLIFILSDVLPYTYAVQRSTLDFVAITLGVVASLRPPAPELTPHRPPQKLCTYKNCTLVFETVLCLAIQYWGLLCYLAAQPWYHGGNGSNINVSPATLPCAMRTVCAMIIAVIIVNDVVFDALITVSAVLR